MIEFTVALHNAVARKPHVTIKKGYLYCRCSRISNRLTVDMIVERIDSPESIDNVMWDYNIISILILLHLPDDGPIIDELVFQYRSPIIRSTLLFGDFYQRFSNLAVVLPHTIAHSNLSFKQRTTTTTTTDKRIYSISLSLIREDIYDRYSDSVNGSQKSLSSLYTF